MNRLGLIIIALATSACVVSCSSGSSSQSASERTSSRKATASEERVTPAPKAEAAPSSTATEPEGAQPLRTLYINVASANIRSMPSKDATIVAKRKFLDTIGATGTLDGEWVQVEVAMPDGAVGTAWIHSTLVSASKEQAEAVKAADDGK